MKTRLRLDQLKIKFFAAILLTFACGCAGPVGHVKTDIDPADLQPGLSVLYLDGGYRFVNQLPHGARAMKHGRPGQPILQINHQFGQGEVFDSGRNSKIGVQMEGYIHLDKPGRYEFQALSNDGVEVYIDGKLIISDPQVHPDRLSSVGDLTIESGKWHPFMVRYFQRKGTAVLKFYWRPPGNDQFTIVPEGAYGHLENK